MVFEWSCVIVIYANAVVMVLSIDYQIQVHTRAQEQIKTYEVIEVALSGYYLVELLLRLMAEQAYFFFAPHANWNCFDLLLVCLSMYEFGFDLSHPGESSGG